MIELAGVSRSYGKKAAVRDLSFTVRPGIVTGFLGPNAGDALAATSGMVLLVRRDA